MTTVDFGGRACMDRVQTQSGLQATAAERERFGMTAADRAYHPATLNGRKASCFLFARCLLVLWEMLVSALFGEMVPVR